MIAAVSTMRWEADRVKLVVDHLRAQGVDEFYISVEYDDMETSIAAGEAGARVLHVEPPFRQDHETTRLARTAVDCGADWVIPFDADEYWCGNGTSIRAALADVPPNFMSVYAPMYLHIDRDHRLPHPKPLGKVAVRAAPNITYAWGAHSSTREGPICAGPLVIRELQYESFEHMREKAEKTRELFAQGHVDPLHGVHLQRLAALTDDELLHEWNAHCSQPTIYDPIP